MNKSDLYIKNAERSQEILDAWEELPENEACETFDAMGCDPDEIKVLCGLAAEMAYTNWMYLAIK